MGIIEALDNAAKLAESSSAQPTSTPATALASSSPTRPGTTGRSPTLRRLHAPTNSQSVTDLEFLSQSLTQPSKAPSLSLSGAGGFSLNYDIETRLHGVDIGGADQAQRLADFVTSSINNVSHGLTVKTAMRSLGLEGKDDVLPGMNVRLLPHQAIGVAWLAQQEKSAHRGGILADDMGLGKTIQMIALMTLHMPTSEDKGSVTLIVVPAALLQQWQDEIADKTNGLFKTHIHHGKDKLKKLEDFDEYDVVITTYQTLNGDFAIPEDIEPQQEAKYLAQKGGVLARTRFYRVIADEAQYIRNRGTRSSLSMAHVRSTYRWMLTGTPVTNTLADIYGLIRFGRFRPWNDWEDFNNHVAKFQLQDAVEAGRRAQAILLPLILRRTKNSQLEGKPILDLKPKKIELVTLKFTKDERELYDSFEKQTRIRINKFLREKTLVKNHSFVLVLILRLRQICCHPNLVLSLSEDLHDPTLMMGTNAEKELSRATKAHGKPWVSGVKKRFLDRALADTYLEFLDDEGDVPNANCMNCKDMFVESNGRVLSCGHEICADCAEALRTSAIENRREFGGGTEKENLTLERQYEEADAKGLRPCPECQKLVEMEEAKMYKSLAFEPSPEEIAVARRHRREQKRKVKRRKSDSDSDVEMADVKPKKTFEEMGLDDSDDDLPDVSAVFKRSKETKSHKKKIVSSDEDDDDDLPMPGSSAKKRPRSSLGSDNDEMETSPSQKKKKTSGMNRRVSNNRTDMPDELLNTWKRGGNNMEPSTKMTELLVHLKEAEAAGDKTICYSQWTSMLDLVEVLFSRNGIRCLRFDGSMSKRAKDDTLHSFKQPDGPAVILISTKCGGVGLNLIAANRIVNMDLSWNYASESQAYDRAHRIGQDKIVYVKRLVVENTIEERMLKLQEVKVGLAEAALGEGTGTKLSKLSVKEIKFLFGMGPPVAPKAPNAENDE